MALTLNANMKDLIDNFIISKIRLGKSEITLENYNYIIAKFCKKLRINNELDITIDKIEEYIDTLKLSGIAGVSINQNLISLKSWIKYLLDMKRRDLTREKREPYINEDKIKTFRNLIEEYELILKLPKVKAVEKEKPPFTINEVKQMLNFYKNEVKKFSYRNYMIIRFAIATGARCTAIRKLKNKDLECYKCDEKCNDCIPIVYILRKGKREEGDEERSKIDVRIEKEACKEVKQYINNIVEDSFVFPSNYNRELSIHQMNEILNKAMKELNIEKKHRSIHSLRHTVLTEALEADSLYQYVARQADHKGYMGITKKYEHIKAKKIKINFIQL